MLGRFTCTIHQLLIRSLCFVENNLLLIQGLQVSVYSLKSVSPPLFIETSSSPLFSPLFLIPLSPYSSFHPSSSTLSLLTPLFTPPPQPSSPHPPPHPSSLPSSSPPLSSTLSLPLLLAQVSCKFCDFCLFEPKLCWRTKLYIPTNCMFYKFWIIMSSSPPSLLAPLLIPLSPHPSSHPFPSPPSLLTLLLTPSLLTLLLIPPPHPPLSSPFLLTPPPHPLFPQPSPYPSSSPGSAASFVILICLNQNFVENKTLYSYQLLVLSILDYNELICHF